MAVALKRRLRPSLAQRLSRWQVRGFHADAASVVNQAAAEAKATGPPPPWQLRRNTPGVMPGVFTVPAPPKVPQHIPRPSYADDVNGRPRPLSEEEYGEVKSAKAIAKMRDASRLAAEALATACDAAREGVTTAEVDRIVCEYIISRGGYPVGIGYYGFPRGVCASPNEVALHGIPNTRPLESGDIVNFDVVAYLGGYYGDCNASVCVGVVDEDLRKLNLDTRECVMATIAQVGPGMTLNSIGDFISTFAKERGHGVVAEFCGHFIGSELHMKPNVLHVPNQTELVLRPGNTFTIEPIFIEGGSAELEHVLEDGWTIVSKSGAWSAQYEHTVLITEHGAEPLTLLE